MNLKVKRITLTIQDHILKTKETVASVFGTLDVKLNTKINKKTKKEEDVIDRVNFIIPFDDNPDFKRHINTMVKEALTLKYGDKI